MLTHEGFFERRRKRKELKKRKDHLEWQLHRCLFFERHVKEYCDRELRSELNIKQAKNGNYEVDVDKIYSEFNNLKQKEIDIQNELTKIENQLERS